MIEEEVKPFERASEPQQQTTDFRPLDSRVVNLWRVSCLIGFGVLLLSLLIPVAAAGVAEPRALVWLALAWLVVAAAAVWFCLWYPPRLYRSWGYRIDAKVLETRSGRLFQRARLLPLSRLQHVDIERGPLERMFGLATLVLIGVVLFSVYAILMPTTTLFFAWTAGVTGGHYSETIARKLRLARA